VTPLAHAIPRPTTGGEVHELLAADLLRLEQESAGGPRLSVFLPLSPGSPRSRKTRVRAEKLLHRAEQALRCDGLPSATVAELMGRVRGALDRARPLNGNHRGVAVFADAEDVRTYDLPLRLPELVAVGNRFAVAPLLPAIDLHGRFFLLTLTHERIRLHEGSALTLEPVDLAGRELAAWTTLPPSRGHGVDSAAEERTTRVRQHFRGTDRALHEVLGEDRPPLVLAGARPLQALYRAASTYPHLLESGIEGNPELIGGDRLHRQSWAIAEPELRRGAAAAVTRFRHLQGTGRTSSDPEEIRRAARDGRVETLLVGQSACAGRPGPGRSVLRLGSAPQAEERLESTVVDTLSRAGAVFVVPDADLPGSSPTAAVLRD
jgi:hypothetical protein